MSEGLASSTIELIEAQAEAIRPTWSAIAKNCIAFR